MATGKNTFTLKWQEWPRDPSASCHFARVSPSVAFSLDGTILAASGGDSWRGQVKLWDPATGKLRGDLPRSSSEIHSVAFSRDGKLLASAGEKLMLCSLTSGGKPADFANKADPRHNNVQVVPNDDSDHPNDFACVSFSPDSKTLATAGWDDLKIKLWDVTNRKRVATLRGHEGYVAYVAFLSDGKTLLSAGNDDDGTIRLWDVATGKNTATALAGHMVCTVWR